jgi:hypothetical protein
MSTAALFEHSIPSKKRSAWHSTLVRIAAGLAALVILAMCFFGIREKQASTILEAKLTELKQSNQPYDSESLAIWIDSKMYPQGTKAWKEILELTALAGPALMSDPRPELDSWNLFQVPSPGEPWPREPVVREALEFLAPVMAAVESASVHPTPVALFDFKHLQYGLYLRGIDRRNDLGNLLALEFRFARYHQNTERMMRAIRLMHAASRAMNNFDYGSNTLSNQLSSLIRESMVDDDWTAQQIEELRDLLRPDFSYLDRAQFLAIQSRVAWLKEFDSPNPRLQFYRNPSLEPLARLPSAKLAVLESTSELIELFSAEPKLIRYLNQSQFGNEEIHAFSNFVSTQSGSLKSLRDTISNQQVAAENLRRFALTALAIKQYQLENGDWPERLEQLKDVNLSARDFSMVQGQPFGFQVATMTEVEQETFGQPDGQHRFAWLWFTKPITFEKNTAVIFSLPLDAHERPTPQNVSVHMPMLRVR